MNASSQPILLGCIPDTPDDRDLSFKDSPLVVRPALLGSDETDLRDLIDNRGLITEEIRRQIAQNCCAHAVRGQVIGTACGMGQPIKPLSAPFLYANARLLEPGSLTQKPRLIDRGSSLRLMYKSVAPKILENGREVGGYGLISEERWPEVPETINCVPPEDCFQAGENALIRRYYRIGDGVGTPDGLRAALKRKLLPTLAIIWDEKFANIQGRIWDGPGGAVYGGHAMLVVAYSTALDAFMLRNSHGPNFGFDGGYCWIGANAAARYSFDKWVAEVVPQAIG